MPDDPTPLPPPVDFQKIVALSKAGVWIIDADNRTTYVNQRMAEMLGTTVEGVLGSSLFDHMDDAGRAIAARKVERSQAGASDHHEFEFLRADGTRLYAVIATHPLTDSEGRYAGSFGVVHDISARKQAEDGLRASEQALRESEDRFRAVVENSPDHVAVLDADARIEFINDGGPVRSVEDVEGQTCYQFLPASAHEAFRASLQRVFGEGEVAQFEVMTHDGRYYLDRVAPLQRDAEGNVLRALMIATDITERRLSADRLRETQYEESLALLAGGIAHDFNNLLVGIMGKIDLALHRGPSQEVADLMSEAREAALAAAELTERLRAYAGGTQLTLSELDLNQLVDDSRGLLHTAAHGDARLVFAQKRPLPPVKADTVQLRQILLNLITNASEAIGGEGTINVRTGKVPRDEVLSVPGVDPQALTAKDYVFLEVEDDGAGMDQRIQRRVFEPFFSTKFTGRGLGLSAVQGIVRSHGGVLRLDSTQGVGTLLRVYLPAATPAAGLAGAPTGQGRTVLVVDDEAVIRSVAQRALSDAGYEVLLAESGREALDLLEQGRQVDLMLLDLVMPDLHGEAVYGEARRLRPTLPIVISSGYSNTGGLREAVEATFLKKPYSLSSLLETVAQGIAAA